MGLFNFFNRGVKAGARYKMITERGDGFYAWDGNLYKSDIVRACIRPKIKAVGKLLPKHIQRLKDGIKVNAVPYMRFLLEEPNPLMTGQMLQEKVAMQLALNNNAFILIIRDDFERATELYPIPCVGVEAVYIDNILYLKFTYRNGKTGMFPYSEIIHLRNDYYNNDIFGESPAPALAPLMEVVTVTDQGIIKAIKNSGVIRWLLKFATGNRPEDIKKATKDFADNYLSIESDTFGAAGINSSTEAQRIEPKDYVPNALQQANIINRLYSFFGVNEKIVQGNYTEDEWNSYYEIAIEPLALQMSGEYTRKIFTRREREFGNSIFFDANNLACASIKTKLALQAMVDRGAMTPNEWRETMNLAPVEGGDTPIRRLDTAPTNTTADEGGEGNEN